MITIQLTNISDLEPISDYHYNVFINKGLIASGVVLGHHRSDGWPALVKMLADAHLKASLTPLTACGERRERDGAVCVKPRGEHRHKFVKVRPA